MEAYLGALRRVALFHGMEDRELLSMLDCLGARLRQYSKGDVIFHAGDPATHLGAVLTGQVQVSRTKADGQRVVMGEIRPGGLFAESFACARAESLPVTVTAAADAAVLLIDCGRISAPCSAACTFHTRLISNLLQVLAEKNLSLAGKLGHLSGRTIRERLLSYLEEQAARTGRATVTVPFDRQALADYLWIRAPPAPAPSSLTGSRTFSAWRKRSSPSSTPGRGGWSMTPWRSGPPSTG